LRRGDISRSGVLCSAPEHCDCRREEPNWEDLLRQPQTEERRLSAFTDCQPVILEESAYDAWLDPQTPADANALLTTRNLDSELQFRRVSRAVDCVKNRGSECVEPVNPL
jgi:hypothetical protein